MAASLAWVGCVPLLFLHQSAAVPAEVVRCDHVSVGAGPAGTYFAWRLALDPATPNGSSICLFDMLERPGGRVASMVGVGPEADLVVEPGAYRFAPDKFCVSMLGKRFCLWTPILGSLISSALHLKSTHYNTNASQFDYNLYKIVDHANHSAGFIQYVLGMLRQAESAAAAGRVQFRTFFQHRLEAVNVPGAGTPNVSRSSDAASVTLSFRRGDGSSVVAEGRRSVMLNLPQVPLLRVLSSSTPAAGLPVQLHGPNPAAYMKLYLHYKDAWWRGGRYGGLDRRAGNFSNMQQVSKPILPEQDAMHLFPGAQSPAPLRGAYHDGDVRCADAGPGRQRCRGYIQAHYSDDVYALMFYRGFGLLGFGEAIVNITRSSHGASGSWLLDEVHSALVELHADALGPDVAKQLLHSEGTRPDHAVLSIWDGAAEGFGAACHFSKLAPGESPADAALDVARHVLRPFPGPVGRRVFVSSEAFAPLQCWSEGALQMAENSLQRLGLRRPPWMPESVYNETLFADAGGPERGFGARHSMPPWLALGAGDAAVLSAGPAGDAAGSHGEVQYL